LQPAFQLGTSLNCNPFMTDVGMHNGAWRESDVSRRDHPGNRSEHGEVDCDNGAFNPTGTGNDDIGRAHRANDLAVHVDWSAGGGIALDDKVLGENTAACVCADRVRPTVEVAMWGLHLGAASAQLRAARLDQKRNERATRSAEIGEEARQSSALHNSSGKDRLPVVPHEL
jgi:hypothetical protein